MNRWATLGFVLVVGLAGCSATPFGQPPIQKEPVPLVIKNNATQSQTFEVSIIEVGKKITIYAEGNVTDNITVSEGSYTLKSPSNPMLRLDLPESARVHGGYTLSPGEKKKTYIKNFSRDSAIVITIYDEEENTYRAIKSLNCGGAPILGYRVETQAEGEDETVSTHQCGT